MLVSFQQVVRSLGEFQAFQVAHAAELSAQRAYEAALAMDRKEFDFQGYCAGCGRVMPLRVDLAWGDGVNPNWRERLQCHCGLNNRLRASLDFLREASTAGSARIYATEQSTAFYSRLKSGYPTAVGSEFLRDGTPRGAANAAGLRHEDLTRLTFASGSFDVVLCFDVLEHLPDYRRALGEMARVLAPGGRLLTSFPFDVNGPTTVVRAAQNPDGSITHLLPPQYHGDPLSADGCLCFQIFGWDVLDEMRQAGFSEAMATIYWSPDRGYLGQNQIMFTGIAGR